jgi:hypothetical protein
MSDTTDDMEAWSGYFDKDNHFDDEEVLRFTLKLLKSICRDVSQHSTRPPFFVALLKQIKFIENHLGE